MFNQFLNDYIRGYAKAIRDIQEIFKYVEVDLNYHHKRMNFKTAKDLLRCCFKNRDKLRKRTNGFIKWNEEKECFEFYEQK